MMQAVLPQPESYKVMVNGFWIRGFSFTQFYPGQLSSSRLQVQYVLGTTENGSFVPSPLPDHERSLDLYDIGEDKRLTRFLEASGPSGAADLYQFDYTDLVRLIQDDLASRQEPVLPDAGGPHGVAE